MPEGFDASEIGASQPSQRLSRGLDQEAGQSGRVTAMSGSTARDQAAVNSVPFTSPSAERLSEVRQGLPLPTPDPKFSASIDLPAGARRTNYLVDPRISLDRKSSNASSFADVSGPILAHATNVGTFPSMDVVQEVERLNTAGSGHSESRHVGVTVGGGIMTDSRSPTHVVPGRKIRSRESTKSGEGMKFSISMPPNSGGEIRQRGNRLSHAADGGRTPDDEAKFDLEAGRDSNSADMDRTFKMIDEGKMDSNYDLGNGDGLAHPAMEGVEVGSRGMRMVQLEMEIEEDSPYPEASKG